MQDNQRYVIFSFLVAGVLLWITLGKFLGAIAYAANVPDPAVFGSINLTSVIGFVISLGLGTYLFKHPRGRPFVNEVFVELRKVTWPSKKETRSATVVVLVTTAIIAMILGVFDLVWAQLTGMIYTL